MSSIWYQNLHTCIIKVAYKWVWKFSKKKKLQGWRAQIGKVGWPKIEKQVRAKIVTLHETSCGCTFTSQFNSQNLEFDMELYIEFYLLSSQPRFSILLLLLFLKTHQ